jgi:hypothetical protein
MGAKDKLFDLLHRGALGILLFAVGGATYDGTLSYFGKFYLCAPQYTSALIHLTSRLHLYRTQEAEGRLDCSQPSVE